MRSHQLREAIAAEIRAEMARKRISQAQLVTALDSNPSSVSRKINGRVALDLDELEAICRFLGLSAPELLSRTNDVISWRRLTLAA